MAAELGRVSIMETTHDEQQGGLQGAPKDLVEEARKQPVVAEAMGAYRALEPFTGTAAAPQRHFKYGTGGNATAPRA